MTQGTDEGRKRTMLLYGDPYRNPNLYFITGFLAPDPVLYLELDGTRMLAVSSMEMSRAEKESNVEDVLSFKDVGYREAMDETGDALRAFGSVVDNLMGGRKDVDISVESTFPVLLADVLRERGYSIAPTSGLLEMERRQKSPSQIEALAQSQSRAEAAISQAIEILAEADILENSVVYRGVPLTVERLRGELDARFAQDGYSNEGMIIAPGAGSADPHWMGSGPILPDQPVILDIFPCNQTSRYFGDVTRTVVKGTASGELKRMYASVAKAHGRALDKIRAGATGRDVHQAVEESFAADGYGDDGPHAARFIHGTGHGLGLEVHEAPRLGRTDTELVVGDVVTVEPGLYDPNIGGVRLEDVVVVTASGYRNLNRLPKQLEIA